MRKEKKRLARLERWETKTEGAPICNRGESFWSIRFEFSSTIVAVEKYISEDTCVNLVRSYLTNIELGNWETEFFMVLN